MNSLVHRSPRKRAEHNDIYALSKGGIGQDYQRELDGLIQGVIGKIV